MDKDTQHMPLSLERFRALLDAYGAGEERWPEPERARAATLLVQSVEARAIRDEAAMLDEQLDEAVAPAPSPTLAASIATLGAAPDRAPSRRFSWLPGRRREAAPVQLAFAGLATACLLVGFLIGWQVNVPRIEPGVVVQPAAEESDEPIDDEGFASLAALDDWSDADLQVDDSETENGLADLPLQ
jgi:hypothetical protein